MTDIKEILPADRLQEWNEAVSKRDRMAMIGILKGVGLTDKAELIVSAILGQANFVLEVPDRIG